MVNTFNTVVRRHFAHEGVIVNRVESTLVGFVVGIACLVLPFVFCWWIAAALSVYHVLSFSEDIIILAAFIGLGFGIILTICCLKNWVKNFYIANVYLMVLVYLSLSVIAVGFLMGLPIGNIVLGILAGLYVGRRHWHRGKGGETFRKAARNVSIFAALVTTLEALPIGILALVEDNALQLFRAAVGLDQSIIAGSMGIPFVVAGCVVLLVVQFWCTRIAAALAFNLGKNVT